MTQPFDPAIFRKLLEDAKDPLIMLAEDLAPPESFSPFPGIEVIVSSLVPPGEVWLVDKNALKLKITNLGPETGPRKRD